MSWVFKTFPSVFAPYFFFLYASKYYVSLLKPKGTVICLATQVCSLRTPGRFYYVAGARPSSVMI